MAKDLKEVTLGEIWSWREPIQQLVDLEPAPPARVGVQIARLAREILREFTLVNDLHQKLIKKYGKEQANGTLEVIFPNDEKKRKPTPDCEKFGEELAELFSQKTKIEPFLVKLPPDFPTPTKTIVALSDFIELEE